MVAEEPRKNRESLKTENVFEKYFGIGGSSSFNEPEHKAVTYDLSDQEAVLMAAESEAFIRKIVINEWNHIGSKKQNNRVIMDKT